MKCSSCRLGASLVAMAFAVAVVLPGGCNRAKDSWSDAKPGQPKVLVSFPPLYCFAAGVAGPDAIVKSLMTKTGPHEHQIGSGDAQVVAGADLFLLNGLMLDEFLGKVVEGSGNKKLKVVEVGEDAIPESKRLKMDGHDDHDHPGKGDKDDHVAKKESGDKHDHDGDKHDHDKDAQAKKDQGEKHDHDHGHQHGEWDPHVWLGIEQAILIVEKIRDELVELDAKHADGYKQRAAEYVAKLKALRGEGEKLLEGKKNRKLIASHDSLRYFCKTFNLELADTLMPQPGTEPDLKKLASLEELCIKDKIHVIAVEPQFPKGTGKVLADNLRKRNHEAALVTIDPLETVPSGADLNADYYFVVMRKNLETLAKSLP